MAGQTFGLEHLQFSSFGQIYRNLTVEELVEHAHKNGEGKFGPNGVMMVKSGDHAERLPNCKFYVDEPSSSDNIWWGNCNKNITTGHYSTLKGRTLSYLSGKNLYLHDGFACASPRYRIPVRLVSEKAWHAHIFQNHLLPASQQELKNFQPEITVINAAGYFEYEFKKYGISSKEFILLNIQERLIIVGGTEHSDEMKMALFSMLNYMLPLKGVLTIHAAANIGKENDVALIVGAPDSGKTSLVHDPNKKSWHRRLIGDDSHGWADEGVFNLEAGCYAKAYNLTRESEPDIFQAVRFGAILENGSYNTRREINFADSSTTFNARISYPQHFVHNAVIPGIGDPPKKLILLSNDMSGVLPPVAMLTIDQTVYYFLSGYSCRVFKKETNISYEPEFSFCFGSSFLPLRPNIYAELLTQNMERHEVKAFLVNTGTTGGPMGTGRQIPIHETRKIIEAILDESFENMAFETDPVFKFEVPRQLAGVDNTILIPKATWNDPDAYEKARLELAGRFNDNFESYAQDVPKQGDIIATKYLYKMYNRLSEAGPHL